jgi:hypothetical protein
VHVLTLSGGGSGGAFGAGALIGLSHRHERPQFEIVTGVSAGALIAPFAFLGPEWDPELADAFTSGRGEGMSIHGIFQLLFSSQRRSTALTSLVDRYITTDLVDAVAREAATGRLLLVATTDLDREEPVIWDMGAIAARGGEPARRLFRDVLVASASIPGVFAPVLIHVQDGGREYDEMHVDGNASTAVFVAPAAAYFSLLDPPSLDGAKVYVLINGQLAGAPRETRLSMGSIVYHTFSTAMKQMSRAQIVAVNQFAEKYRMSVRSTYLPVDYPPYNSADFRASTMRTMFDYGAHCAEQGRLWTSVADAIAGISAAAADQSVDVDAGLRCPSRDPGARLARQ